MFQAEISQLYMTTLYKIDSLMPLCTNYTHLYLYHHSRFFRQTLYNPQKHPTPIEKGMPSHTAFKIKTYTQYLY